MQLLCSIDFFIPVRYGTRIAMKRKVSVDVGTVSMHRSPPQKTAAFMISDSVVNVQRILNGIGYNIQTVESAEWGTADVHHYDVMVVRNGKSYELYSRILAQHLTDV